MTEQILPPPITPCKGSLSWSSSLPEGHIPATFGPHYILIFMSPWLEMPVRGTRIMSGRNLWNHLAQPPLQRRNPLSSFLEYLPFSWGVPVMGCSLVHFISVHSRGPDLFTRNIDHILDSLSYQLIISFLVTLFIQMIFFLKQQNFDPLHVYQRWI